MVMALVDFVVSLLPYLLIMAWLIQANRPAAGKEDDELTVRHSLIVLGEVCRTKEVDWKVNQVTHKKVEYAAGLSYLVGSVMELAGDAKGFELAIRYLRDYTQEEVLEVLTIRLSYPDGEADRLDFTLLDDVPIEWRINYCSLKLDSVPAGHHGVPARLAEQVCRPAVCLTGKQLFLQAAFIALPE